MRTIIWISPRNKRTFFLPCFSFVLFIALYIFRTHTLEKEALCWSDQQYCNPDIIQKYDVYKLPERGPAEEDSIILLEGYGHTFLLPRMLCVLESIANVNTRAWITVFFKSEFIHRTPLMDAVLNAFENIQIVHLNEENLFKNSPLQKWYLQRRWEESLWPKSHYNDALRWLLLWNYGGIYLDFDVHILQPLPRLGNFSCAESDEAVGAGALGFQMPHHPLVKECLHRFASDFNGEVWGWNGPMLLTRVLEDRCGMELPSRVCPRCPDINILPSKAFYPIPWTSYQKYLVEEQEVVDSVLSDPDVLAAHTWNSLLNAHPVDLKRDSLYATIAKERCPNVADMIRDIL